MAGREPAVDVLVVGVLVLVGPVFVLALGSAGLSLPVLVAAVGVPVGCGSPCPVSSVCEVGGACSWPSPRGATSTAGSASSATIGSIVAASTPSGFILSEMAIASFGNRLMCGLSQRRGIRTGQRHPL